jgi:hypothetical protein
MMKKKKKKKRRKKRRREEETDRKDEMKQRERIISPSEPNEASMRCLGSGAPTSASEALYYRLLAG